VFISGALVVFFVAFIYVRHSFPGGIIPYQGMSLGIVLAILQYAAARASNKESFINSAKDALTTILLIYAFVLTVPTTADRSYTVQLLRYVGGAPNGVSREQIAQFYVSDFVYHGGIEKRLTEQKATGTMIQRDGLYFLTRSGVALDWAFRSTCTIFICQHSPPEPPVSHNDEINGTKGTLEIRPSVYHVPAW
jgi:hypothetical protein